jgi:plastocyanin
MRQITAMAIVAAVVTLSLASIPSAYAGGGCHNGVFSDETNTHVELSKNCFEPTVVRVQPGDTVTWNNSDPVAHTVTGAGNLWADDKKIAGGESLSYAFAEEGVFPYFCYLHPSMVGAVVVGDGSGGVAAAGSGVKAISAVAPAAAGDAPQPEAETTEETDGSDMTVPLVIAVGVLAAITGIGMAFIMRRWVGDRLS